MVAFDYAAAAEWVRSGHNGWLAPRGDEAAFVDAAVRLALDVPLRHALAANARASVAELAWSAVSGRLAGVIEDVVQAHEARGAALAPIAGS